LETLAINIRPSLFCNSSGWNGLEERTVGSVNGGEARRSRLNQTNSIRAQFIMVVHGRCRALDAGLDSGDATGKLPRLMRPPANLLRNSRNYRPGSSS